jgi:hypothetical protein
MRYEAIRGEGHRARCCFSLPQFQSMETGINGTMIKEKFRVYRQISEFFKDHDVYIWPLDSLKSNDLVRITCRNGGDKNKIYVWIRLIDSYYINFYEKTIKTRFPDDDMKMIDKPYPIVLNRHYRSRLGLTEECFDRVLLEIKKVNNPHAVIASFLSAPDSLVRITTLISLVSLFLGLIGLLLGIFGLLR